MKKNLSKILVAVMVLTVATVFSACGGNSKYVGTWEGEKAEMSGIEMQLSDLEMTMEVVIDKDGTITMTTNDEDDGTGKWEEDGDNIKITDSSDDEITGSIEDDQLVLEFADQDFKVYLTKKD